MSTPFGYAARLADAYQRTGAQILLRQVSGTGGPSPLINPPRVTGAVLSAPVSQMATAVSIAATTAAGRLVPGDIINAAGVQLVVTTAAAALPVMTPGFGAIGIQPAPAAIASGTPVTFTFGADLIVFGEILSYPISLIDGDKIRSRDLQVKIAAYNLPDEIPPDWSIIINGREMAVLSAVPTFMRGEIMSWTIQARL